MSRHSVALSDLDIYGFVDPASGGAKNPAAELCRQAIVIAGTDQARNVFVLYAWAGRLAASAFAAKIIQAYSVYRPKLMGIEANAMQSLFAALVRDKAKEVLQDKVGIYPVKQPTHLNKHWRIRTAIEPVLRDGRLYISRSHRDLEYELRSFPTGKSVDLVDALASTLALMPKRHTSAIEESQSKRLEDYLRQTESRNGYALKVASI
jgi:hypothetical protein